MDTQKWRKIVGIISAVLALILTICITLGMLNFLPLLSHKIFGETVLRFLTQVAITLLLISAVAFWEV